MGITSTHLLLPSSLSPPPHLPSFHLFNSTISIIPSLNHPTFSSKLNPSSTSTSNPNRAFRGGRFEFEDDLRGDSRRNWWSDSDDDDDDDDDEFWYWEEPSSFDWIFKVVRAFGWMVPAVLVSTLLGTGTNSLIMAVVLPLGQTALSLVLDKMWEGTSSRASPGSRSRPRRSSGSRNSSRAEKYPYAKTAYGSPRHTQAREASTRRSSERGDYQPWKATSNRSAKKGGESKSRFGGWDELDKQEESNNSFSREMPSPQVNGLQKQQIWTGKLSRKGNREKPLFMRLLIAIFPLLGSWTRFLF